MKKPTKDSIAKATQRVKNTINLGALRKVPKFKNLTELEYNRLIKSAEIFAILILESYIAVTSTNV